MLSIKNISFSYKKSQILSGISLHVKQGDYLAIVGESGSGKSTLTSLLCFHGFRFISDDLVLMNENQKIYDNQKGENGNHCIYI